MHTSESAFERRDQAEGLRRLAKPRPVKLIAVASGKGGVGKTSAAVNLSVALAAGGRSTLLLDADLGLANVDVLLGLRPAANLSHVLSGERELEEVILEGPSGLRIVPASSGSAALADLGAAEQAGLIRAFGALKFAPEVLVVDTAPGIGRTVATFCQATHEVVVVVCDEPSSIADAYALIKVLSQTYGIERFQILASMVRDDEQGSAVHKKLLGACDRFLDVNLHYLGSVPRDELLLRAVRSRQAVVAAYPGSASARAFKEIARRADKWTVPAGNGGQIEFFLERMLAAPVVAAAG